MWKFLRLICWVLCPFVLVGYGASLAKLVSETPHIVGLQLVLVAAAAGMILHFATRTVFSFGRVLHHEVTHLVLVLLCFRRPRALWVKEGEGFVVFAGHEENFLITLGPYFLPIAALFWLPLGLVFRHDMTDIYVGVLGVLTGYGLGQSIGDFHPAQPDIDRVGLVFSIVFCAAGNILVLGFLLAVAAGGFDRGLIFLEDGLQSGWRATVDLCDSLYLVCNRAVEAFRR